MSDIKSVFETLSSVDVSRQIQTKGKFGYLSWSNAVRELLKKFPTAEWEFGEWDSMPYLKTETGYFVTCTVTVNGIPRKQIMPILDFKNQSVKLGALTSDQVNKAQMRALAKAIALHGLGLELWAGEDLELSQEEMMLEQKRKNMTRSELTKYIQESGYTIDQVTEALGVEFNKLDIKSTFDTVTAWRASQ